MAIEIKERLQIQVFGFGGKAENKDYAGTAFKLMDKLWQLVKSKQLDHQGKNVWVYEPKEMVFAGVEFNTPPESETGLEQKTLIHEKYAYFKHIGPYHLIKEAGQKMQEELSRQGFEIKGPYIEIYGHWSADESKLETELLMVLE